MQKIERKHTQRSANITLSSRVLDASNACVVMVILEEGDATTE